MSVIAELSLPAGEFELGRILDTGDQTTVTLERMVPMDERTVPFIRLRDEPECAFTDRVADHPAVSEIEAVGEQDGAELYALDWQITRDEFFRGLLSVDAHLLEAVGRRRNWEFEIRFASHGRLSAFHDHCSETDIGIELDRVYGSTTPDPGYGMTQPQRETLMRAVEEGYYAIPREITTRELAAEFDISDQAITERLRRAIRTLVGETLPPPERAE